MYVCMSVLAGHQLQTDAHRRRISTLAPPTVLKSTVGRGTAIAWMSHALPGQQRGDMYAYIYIYIYCLCHRRCIPLLLRHADFFVGVALASNGVRQSYRQGSAPAASLCLPSTCRAAPLLLPPLFAPPGCTYMFFSPLCQSPAFQGRRVLTQHPLNTP